ncbi:MAG: PAS domain S-box protein [Nitrospirae bacterium]|nr:PAS domain S-box protein [Nitrospirota bacterium]
MAKSKILIVEDEWIIANDIKKSLQNLGYSVSAIVSTGEEAINKIQEKKPDLVLMDIVLQGEISGTEAANQIISGYDIPVIYLTAYSDKEILKQAKKTNAYGYLVKPFNERELQATIDLAIYKHRMEEQLKRSNNQLLTTLNSISDAVISTDKDGLVILMNPVAQSLTGWLLSDVKDRHLSTIFKIKYNEPGDAEDTVSKIIQVREPLTQAKFILKTRNGSNINIELSSAPISDNETITGYVVVFRDITERITNETKLEQYREELEQLAEESTAKLKLFSNIAENSPDGVLIINFEGHIIYSNHAIKEIFGFSHSELKGKHVNVMNTDSGLASKTIIPSIKNTGKWFGELMVRNKKGNVFPIWLSAFVVNDKSNIPFAIIGIIRDLTERKIVEIALQQSQDKYSKLFHHSSDAIFIHDFDGNILDVNRKALEQFGYSKSEILSLQIHDLFPAEEIEKSITVCNAVVKQGAGNFEINFKRKSNSVFPAGVSANLLDLGGYKVFQCIVRDISERKKADEELKKHREQLEELVKDRTCELLEANHALQVEISVRKQAEKRLLSYQKQLQSLTSQISLIEEHEKRRIATELHDCIGQTLALSKIKLSSLNKTAPSDDFKSTVKEILQLIEQTIKETRTLTFELSPPILYELGLSQAIQWLTDQFRSKHGIKITLEYDEGEMPFDNNIRFFLFQAVRELLVNIVKHAKAKRATIKFIRDDNKLKIIVEDDGMGLPDSSIPYSGYGLFHIRERMNHINGHFEIKSIPGLGTRVTIVAPFQLSIKTT